MMKAIHALTALMLARAVLQADPPIDPALKDFVENFKGKGALTDGSTPLTPQETLSHFKIAPGLELQVVASEPVIRQPLNLHFDDRGRLWVVQYLQYPFPAGLKVLKYDQYLRAVFDKVPEPPPRGTPGADRITILEDRDGDGIFESHKDFVTSLNIATSVLTGHGGVWVLNPPYLLFYPDKNHDDVPDTEPEVRLSGFGLEDTHAVASSLAWGPDGWIYGAQGSTTTSTIQGIHFLGQAIWRYHPDSHAFEVFAEGGGNTFSLEFDQLGRAFSGTNHGSTRGLHYVQGGAYIKNWAKHGPLLNPYSFGWFEHMPSEGYQPRFAQSMLIYEGGAIPSLEGRLIASMSLTNRVLASDLLPDTSSFKTRDSAALLETDDRWFRPVDTKTGPDGALYIADWYDSRLTHVDPRDTWDHEHGRIYRLQAAGAKPAAPFDLGRASNAELLRTLEHPNKWFRQTAVRLLSERRDPSILPALHSLLDKAGKGQAISPTSPTSPPTATTEAAPSAKADATAEAKPAKAPKDMGAKGQAISPGIDIGRDSGSNGSPPLPPPPPLGTGNLSTAPTATARESAKGGPLGGPLGPLGTGNFSAAQSAPQQQQGEQGERALPAGVAKGQAISQQHVASAHPSHPALEALWVLHQLGAFDSKTAIRSLSHPEPAVRAWAIRLMGDPKTLPPDAVPALLSLARTEPDAQVRSQLACSAKRWPADAALPLIRELLGRTEDAEDRHIPLLLWWAFESKLAPGSDAALAWLEDPQLWRNPTFQSHFVRRLGQRFTAEPSPQNLATAAHLLAQSPSPEITDSLITGMEAGLQGDPLSSVPEPLTREAGRAWTTRPHTPVLLSFALRLGLADAAAEALQKVAHSKTPDSERRKILPLLGERRIPGSIPVLLELLRTQNAERLQLEILSTLQTFNDPALGPQLVLSAKDSTPRVRAAIAQTLSTREQWALPLLEALDSGAGLRREDFAPSAIATIAGFHDPRCEVLLKKHFGQSRPSPAQKQQRIDEIRRLLTATTSTKGDPAAGKPLFTRLCTSCHTLHGEGGRIGPDLSGYERSNLDFLLPAILDPSLGIREEYTAFTLRTTDGQILTGFVAEKSAASVTLVDLAGTRSVIAAERIASLQASPASLMPEGLLDALSDTELRDFFAYLTKP